MLNLGHMGLTLRLIRLILNRAIGACSIISHSLTLCCIDITDTLRMQFTPLLEYLMQIYVFIDDVLTKTAVRIWIVNFEV